VTVASCASSETLDSRLSTIGETSGDLLTATLDDVLSTCRSTRIRRTSLGLLLCIMMTSVSVNTGAGDRDVKSGVTRTRGPVGHSKSSFGSGDKEAS